MPHIDPAGCTRYTGIQCEYEGALGAMYHPTNLTDGCTDVPKASLVEADLNAIDLYTVVGADEQVLDPADDARLDKVGALRIDLNGHVGRFELELFRVNEVRRA